MLTKEQVELYKAHHNEINSKLKEIGGEPLDITYLYWSCVEYNSTDAWYYTGRGAFYNGLKSTYCSIRPVLNLK